MHYLYSPMDGENHFIMERLPIQNNGVFSRIDADPAGKDLYWFFCEQQYKFHMPPKVFSVAKTQYRVMNDAPPSIYMATVLWEDCCSDAIQRGLYHPDRGPLQAYVPLEMSVDELRRRLDREWAPREEGRSVDKDWIKDGFAFLQTAGLAEFDDRDKDKVTLRLQPIIGTGSSDLPTDLSERYVKKGMVDAQPKKRRAGRGRRSSKGEEFTGKLFEV
jgi:hypothetical protein